MVWEIEIGINGQIVSSLVRPLQLPVGRMIYFIYPYMKAKPAINSSNFSILLAESTKCATTTLLSTTFRQPGVLVGVSDGSHKLGSLAPCRTNFGADMYSIGITTTCYSDYMSPEDLGQF